MIRNTKAIANDIEVLFDQYLQSTSEPTVLELLNSAREQYEAEDYEGAIQSIQDASDAMDSDSDTFVDLIQMIEWAQSDKENLELATHMRTNTKSRPPTELSEIINALNAFADKVESQEVSSNLVDYVGWLEASDLDADDVRDISGYVDDAADTCTDNNTCEGLRRSAKDLLEYADWLEGQNSEPMEDQDEVEGLERPGKTVNIKSNSELLSALQELKETNVGEYFGDLLYDLIEDIKDDNTSNLDHMLGLIEEEIDTLETDDGVDVSAARDCLQDVYNAMSGQMDLPGMRTNKPEQKYCDPYCAPGYMAGVAPSDLSLAGYEELIPLSETLLTARDVLLATANNCMLEGKDYEEPISLISELGYLADGLRGTALDIERCCLDGIQYYNWPGTLQWPQQCCERMIGALTGKSDYDAVVATLIGVRDALKMLQEPVETGMVKSAETKSLIDGNSFSDEVLKLIDDLQESLELSVRRYSRPGNEDEEFVAQAEGWIDQLRGIVAYNDKDELVALLNSIFDAGGTGMEVTIADQINAQLNQEEADAKRDADDIANGADFGE